MCVFEFQYTTSQLFQRHKWPEVSLLADKIFPGKLFRSIVTPADLFVPWLKNILSPFLAYLGSNHPVVSHILPWCLACFIFGHAVARASLSALQKSCLKWMSKSLQVLQSLDSFQMASRRYLMENYTTTMTTSQMCLSSFSFSRFILRFQHLFYLSSPVTMSLTSSFSLMRWGNSLFTAYIFTFQSLISAAFISTSLVTLATMSFLITAHQSCLFLRLAFLLLQQELHLAK